MREAALEVAADQAGERLDRYLASVLPGHSRSQVQRLIEQGHVRVEGREVRANLLIKAGDRIAVVVPAPSPATPEAEDIPLTVLYEDADLIVIDKPAGMVVHPAAGHASGTLVNALLHHVQDLSGVGGELRPGIVHRLDKGTSGVMVVAKHDKAHEELARQFEEREVEKVYIALVWGVVQAGRRIDLPIGRDPNNRQKMSSRARRTIFEASRCATSRSPPAARIRSACTSAPSATRSSAMPRMAAYGRECPPTSGRCSHSTARSFTHASSRSSTPSMDGRCSGRRRSRRICSVCSTSSKRCRSRDAQD
jgi:23S rRNA-/tRNA-specific pseudouridylate synthase